MTNTSHDEIQLSRLSYSVTTHVTSSKISIAASSATEKISVATHPSINHDAV